MDLSGFVMHFSIVCCGYVNGRFWSFVFIVIARQREVHAERNILFYRFCPSVCLSNDGIVSKQINTSSDFFSH